MGAAVRYGDEMVVAVLVVVVVVVAVVVVVIVLLAMRFVSLAIGVGGLGKQVSERLIGDGFAPMPLGILVTVVLLFVKLDDLGFVGRDDLVATSSEEEVIQSDRG